jgi:hypothetical protein
MVRFLFAALALALLASGCLGSGIDGDMGPGPTRTAGAPAACGDASDAVREEGSPGMAARADSNVHDDASANRTYRWDLAVESVCRAEESRVEVSATRAPAPEDCDALDLRAAVSTGVQEIPIALDGDPARGSAEFTAGRPDLQPGAGSFVVSLTASLPSDGFQAHDDQCVDAILQSFALRATFHKAA